MTRFLPILAPRSTLAGKVQRSGVILLVIIAMLALLAPLLTPYGPADPVCAPFARPNSAHLLGCDDAGHDILTQLFHGARVSLFVGTSVAVLGTGLALLVALSAGLRGGWIDHGLMRIVDVTLSLPFLPFVIVLGAYFGSSLAILVAAIASVLWAQSARELRAQVLSLRAAGFVEASLSMGASGRFVARHHVLPELAPLVVPQVVRIAHHAILIETALSFLGLGDPSRTSWGTILYHANARSAFLTGTWVWWIVPAGLAVSVTVLALALVGFGFDASLFKGHRTSVRRRQPPTTHPVQADGAILSVRDLTVTYGTAGVLHGVDLDLGRGEVLGLVGDSGSGKTTLAHALIGMPSGSGEITSGDIVFDHQCIGDLSPDQLRNLCGRKIALIPQNAMNALNPVMSVGEQLAEAIALSASRPVSPGDQEVTEWLERVGLSPSDARRFPHELSGGMRQRAVISVALCGRPQMLIADEPTIGLDVLVQRDIMDLLLDLRQRLDLSILFISHNRALVRRYADRLVVLRGGRVVQGETPDAPGIALMHVRAQKPAPTADPIEAPAALPTDDEAILAFEHVSKDFHSHRTARSLGERRQPALRNISFRLRAGEKLGLVGESGAGKSTIARLAMGLIEAESGEILVDGMKQASGHVSSSMRMILQDPYNAMRKAMTVRATVAEPLRIAGQRAGPAMDTRVRDALTNCRLPDDDDFCARIVAELSGGQRQRLALARAIVTNPQVIVADEPTSMLDPSTQSEIVQLMERLGVRFGTAFLLVTHDIHLARAFCDRIIVLRNGEIIEEGAVHDVFRAPSHAYTRALIDAA